jgi:hypothetical protein
VPRREEKLPAEAKRIVKEGETNKNHPEGWRELVSKTHSPMIVRFPNTTTIGRDFTKQKSCSWQ